MELSLNEVESLGIKAARGAGFSWGLAEDVGRAAATLARRGVDWSALLVQLLSAFESFDPPSPRRAALWRRGDPDVAGERPLCPVRAAAALNDAPPDADAPAPMLRNVGLPIWLDASLATYGPWRAPADATAPVGDVALLRETDAGPAGVRRARISPAAIEALNAWAARTYVPESLSSRTRGAGGGSVDDE